MVDVTLRESVCVIPCSKIGIHLYHLYQCSRASNFNCEKSYNVKIIELKIDTDLIRSYQREIKFPPANNSPTTVLDEWYKQLSNEDLPSKGNVSAVPHVINYVPKNLSKDNLKDIEYLILNKRFIPYLQPKALQPPIPKEYLFKDDYKKMINVI